MKPSDCATLVAKILAAFPSPPVGDETIAVYVESLVDLASPACLEEAVQALVRTDTRRPSIAVIREEYRRHIDKHRPAAIEEAPVDEQTRAANVARWRALQEQVYAGMKDVA